MPIRCAGAPQQFDQGSVTLRLHATAVSSVDDFALALKAALAPITPTLIEVTTADLHAA
jgi:hypothetical protein